MKTAMVLQFTDNDTGITVVVEGFLMAGIEGADFARKVAGAGYGQTMLNIPMQVMTVRTLQL